jgi:DNA topoisomerase-3
VKLCIAEKPSVGREIAEVLGARGRRDGYYEGNGYQVTWTFGHLCTLKMPDQYTPEWKRWSLHVLPMIPEKFETDLIKQKGISKQFKIIKSLVKGCTEVINCGDAGIEGELIQRWVLAKAGCKKPVRRLWISSLTEEAIKEGFNSLKPSADYDLLYAAGSARAIGDWLLGMNASRLYTLKYANGKAVLSIGRVQTPTLGLIVKRHLEIENFKPEAYWVLKTIYRDVVFTSEKKRYDSKKEAENLLEQIKDDNFTISSFKQKEAKEQPPQLFDLTSLQVEANKKLGYSADQTLKDVQKLYEKKLVTYPRVDTRFLPSDLYPKVPGILGKLNNYAEFTKPLLTEKIAKNKRVFDDKKITDHHAIIPTGVVPRNMTPREEKIYDMITRRFIAAFYPDCLLLNTTVFGEAAGVKFKATGKQVLNEGWRVLYKKDQSDKDKKTEQLIPEFKEGESGPHKPEIEEKETKPPKHYTEATLLRAMETAGKQIDDDELKELMKENGIGRPSTRANIIETLFRRNYVRKIKKSLVPTDTGIELIAIIENELLKSVELTGLWEKKLRQIERAEYQKDKFLAEMKEMISTLVLEVKQGADKTISVTEQKKRAKKNTAKKSSVKKSVSKKESLESLTCPKCKQGRIIKGKAAYGCNRFREGCDFRVNFELYGKKLTGNQLVELVSKGKTKPISGFMVNRVKQNGRIELSEDYKIIMVSEVRSDNNSVPVQTASLTCPKCKQGKIIKGRKAYGCNRYKEGCDFVISFAEFENRFNVKS